MGSWRRAHKAQGVALREGLVGTLCSSPYRLTGIHCRQERQEPVCAGGRKEVHTSRKAQAEDMHEHHRQRECVFAIGWQFLPLCLEVLNCPEPGPSPGFSAMNAPSAWLCLTRASRLSSAEKAFRPQATSASADAAHTTAGQDSLRSCVNTPWTLLLLWSKRQACGPAPAGGDTCTINQGMPGGSCPASTGL